MAIREKERMGITYSKKKVIMSIQILSKGHHFIAGIKECLMQREVKQDGTVQRQK